MVTETVVGFDKIQTLQATFALLWVCPYPVPTETSLTDTFAWEWHDGLP